MRTTWLTLLAVTAAMQAEEPDPFLPYLDGVAPPILREVPVDLPVPAGVQARRVVFQSRDGSEIAAVIAAPTAPGTYPGILVLHGGGGLAEGAKAVAWADRGYIAVAPDLPGIAQPEKLTDTVGRWNGWKYGEHRWTAEPDATASVIFDAVVAGLKALDLLRAQPGVDGARIGVVGISWGGYMTTMLCGLVGPRVRAAFSVFGSGFYELTSNTGNLAKMTPPERLRWLAHLDAGRRAPHITAAYFVAGATNDFFFYPAAVQATLDAIPGERNRVWAPNADHTMTVPGGMAVGPATPHTPTAFQPVATPQGTGTWMAMEVPWFAYHLQGHGAPFPTVRVEPGADPRQVVLRTTAPEPLTGVTVVWAPAHHDVKTRVWTSIPATADGPDRYRAELPPEAVTWFATASDTRPVSVSTDLVQIP